MSKLVAADAAADLIPDNRRLKATATKKPDGPRLSLSPPGLKLNFANTQNPPQLYALISNPFRCSRFCQPLASLSPTISSATGSHFNGRFSRIAMFARWQVVIER